MLFFYAGMEVIRSNTKKSVMSSHKRFKSFTLKNSRRPTTCTPHRLSFFSVVAPTLVDYARFGTCSPKRQTYEVPYIGSPLFAHGDLAFRSRFTFFVSPIAPLLVVTSDQTWC